MLAEKISELKKKILEMARTVEDMLDQSIQGLLEKNKNKLDSVFELEDQVNRMEMEIEEECTSLIALHQPEAKNLRTILMILKMNNDLERMGDHAISIVKCALFLITVPFIKRLTNIPVMAAETKKMVENTITAFVNEDVTLAEEVCKNDDIVDDLKEHIYRILITYVLDDPTSIKRAFHINKISANLERIADLTTNIAEDTIFMTAGKVIKHRTGDVRK